MKRLGAIDRALQCPVCSERATTALRKITSGRSNPLVCLACGAELSYGPIPVVLFLMTVVLVTTLIVRSSIDIAIGLLFGTGVGMLVLAVTALPSRMRPAWPLGKSPRIVWWSSPFVWLATGFTLWALWMVFSNGA